MAGVDIFDGRTAPTAEEREQYYYGLPSQPKLVARSSTEAWSIQYDGHAIGKTFSPVGRHAIAKLWNDSTTPLRRAIIQAIDGIDWSTIDVLRIGYERTNGFTHEEFTHPVTLLISVQEGSTTWAQGLLVAIRCHEILGLHGIPDVHCEIRESHFSRGNSSTGEAPVPAPTFVGGQIDPPIKTRALWSEYLGLSIAASNSPTREGTKCLYLRLKDSGKIVALTCRHVVFEESKIEPEFRYDGTQQRWTVMQPGSRTLAKHSKIISSRLGRIDNAIEEIESYQKLSENDRRRMIQVQRDSLPVLMRAERDIGELDDPAKRIFGHVIYAPALSIGKTDTQGDRLRDWALIELHPDKYATPLANLCNQVFVGPDDDFRDRVEEERLAEGFTNGPEPLFDVSSRTIFLREMIPETEMRKPSEEARSLGDDRAILVGKHGCSTGLTIGLATGVVSLVRQPIDGILFQSEEWCIISHKRDREDCRINFSSKGDSGCCVWELSGRIGGRTVLTSSWFDTQPVAGQQFDHDLTHLAGLSVHQETYHIGVESSFRRDRQTDDADSIFETEFFFHGYPPNLSGDQGLTKRQPRKKFKYGHFIPVAKKLLDMDATDDTHFICVVTLGPREAENRWYHFWGPDGWERMFSEVRKWVRHAKVEVGEDGDDFPSTGFCFFVDESPQHEEYEFKVQVCRPGYS
ncbi:hypothetical protein FALBO_7395 [Fusarium albosuccineum]|uniref:Uncharacterized protein n=1 Tax=Fusarium albosuccineum TaxID=1237068 RepID=A0A8H4LBE8_9HYPO|nr:hypothetical protein FALBO_7395 [Fusarium albosuccineum]